MAHSVHLFSGSNFLKYEAESDSLPTSYTIYDGRSNRNDLVDHEAFISEDVSVSDVYQELQR